MYASKHSKANSILHSSLARTGWPHRSIFDREAAFASRTSWEREARIQLPLSDAEILKPFVTLGMTVRIGDLAFTLESLEDYRQARLNAWFDPGRIIVDEPCLLIVDDVRPLTHRLARKVVVRDFGPTRVVAGAEVKDRNRVRFARALS